MRGDARHAAACRVIARIEGRKLGSRQRDCLAFLLTDGRFPLAFKNPQVMSRLMARGLVAIIPEPDRHPSLSPLYDATPELHAAFARELEELGLTPTDKEN
jgi:hypothetical protein